MSDIKEEFKNLLLRIKNENGHSYAFIAKKSGVGESLIKRAGGGRPFKPTREDVDALKRAYPEKEEAQEQPVQEGSIKQINEKLDRLLNLMDTTFASQRDELIATLMKKYGKTEEEVLGVIKSMIEERIEKEAKEEK